MTTLESPPPSEIPETTETHEPKKASKGLLAVIVILVLAVVGVGLWAIVDSNDSSSASLPSGAEEALDGYMDASSTYDGEAFLAVVTDDYLFEAYNVSEDATAHAATITDEWSDISFAVEVTGDSAVAGDDTGYVVAEPQAASWAGQSGQDGMSVFTLVEVDGTWLIQSHEWVVQGFR